MVCHLKDSIAITNDLMTDKENKYNWNLGTQNFKLMVSIFKDGKPLNAEQHEPYLSVKFG